MYETDFSRLTYVYCKRDYSTTSLKVLGLEYQTLNVDDIDVSCEDGEEGLRRTRTGLVE